MYSYHQIDDFKLIELIQAGEELAFKEIYNRHWERLFTMACNRLDNEVEAEEIVQEIFCDFWKKINGFQLTKSLESYFAVAVKYRIINYLAKRARESQYKKELFAVAAPTNCSILESLDYKELLSRFTTKLDSLPEKCRIVFQLRYEQGLTQRQIAEKLHVSEKTVEAHLAKARKTLRGAIMLFCILHAI